MKMLARIRPFAMRCRDGVAERTVRGLDYLLEGEFANSRLGRAADRLSARAAPALAWVLAAGPARAFVVVVAATAVLALLWASLMSIDVVVRAEGRVVPAGKAQIVQHLEGGIVSAILVHEGESVSAGQPLMELSDVRAKSDLGQERTQLSALLGKEARLNAESQGLEAITFPETLKEEAVRRAESATFRARQARTREEAAVLRSQSEQKRGEIRETDTRRLNLGQELDVARRQLSVLEGLRAKGAASQFELLDAQSRVQRLVSQSREAEASLPRLRAALAETEARAQETSARFRSEAATELAQVRAEIEKLRYGINAGTDRLARSTVTAPMAGYVNRLNVNTVGGVVRPGDPILEITPADSGIAMEGKVQPNDRASLREGLPARVRIGAYDYAMYGVLEGEVKEVSADTLADEHGERYYRVRVEAAAKPDLHPVPGMTAQTDVVVGRRTIVSYLLSPLLRFRDSAFRDPR
jgi:adhesin transport system membrane fusion protein